MDENVAKAVARFERHMKFVLAKCDPSHDWQTIRARLVELEAENERLRAKTAVTLGVGNGDGSLFVHGDYESIKAAQALVLKAERPKKAEALLREAIARLSTYHPADQRLVSSITAHLSENGHD